MKNYHRLASRRVAEVINHPPPRAPHPDAYISIPSRHRCCPVFSNPPPPPSPRKFRRNSRVYTPLISGQKLFFLSLFPKREFRGGGWVGWGIDKGRIYYIRMRPKVTTTFFGASHAVSLPFPSPSRARIRASAPRSPQFFFSFFFFTYLRPKSPFFAVRFWPD